ncbi:Protein of unknown function [Kushneria avicenniae]|uniref:DUF2835 domain-containing protein n=1 Tax=Kushneria avicenniae TaxID=402385 RepID=A0A1I1GCV7_9GAMM|nr:DUF2835 family protein [Kushneria avicenniae]SFC06950.1 Protein of unknown function [Kushneria avicenniae]
MPYVDISLSLTLDQCRRYYAGHAEWVDAHSVDGRRVRFPARALRRIVGPNGVHGVYRLAFDGAGRFESLVSMAS